MKAKINAKFCIPNYLLTDILGRVKAQCNSCHERESMPPNPTATPIISLEFGERILVDLKQLQGRAGYIVVAICHWSNYCWLEYLRDKTADGVADFLTNKVFPDVERLRKSWRGAYEESKKSAKATRSYPVNEGELETGDNLETAFQLSLLKQHEDMQEVR